MVHEFNGFQLEDNSHLGMGFQIYNWANFRYCSLSMRNGIISINTTGTNLSLSEAVLFTSELQTCIETMNHFTQILNSK